MTYDLFRVELAETDDSGDQQTNRVLGVGGEELTKVPRIQHFGESSVPPKGSHGIGLALHGRRDLAVILGMEMAAHRPRNLNPGEKVIYDAFGTAISLVQQNLRMVHSEKIEQVCGGALIRMTADGTVEINP